jgi:hypothetical protein
VGNLWVNDVREEPNAEEVAVVTFMRLAYWNRMFVAQELKHETADSPRTILREVIENKGNKT